jgi:diguanylate cyclase (GGDEF)-like protein
MNVPSRRVAVIADDEDLGRLLLAEACTHAGLEPRAFDNGRDALTAAAADANVAIALLDVDMPGMDGYSVCRALRADAALGNLPIVMVTGHDDGGAIDAAFEAGATDFVTKPVNWALLPHRLGYILRNADAAQRIERLAYFDSLTGLPNRPRCLEIARRMAAASPPGHQVGAVHLEMTRLARISDTFGHPVADAVLASIAGTLRTVLKLADPGERRTALARVGDTAFVLLCAEADARRLALRLTDACRVALAGPIEHGSLEFYATPAVGVAVYPDHAGDAESLLQNAATAAHRAHASAPGVPVVYAPAMNGRMRDWLDLDARLRRALRDGALALHYQPKFRVADGRLTGVEALVRWFDPEYGEIAPNNFIPMAEESGLITRLGGWVVRTACQQIRRWADAGIELPVAVNVSGQELQHGDPAAFVEATAQACGVSPALLEIEITESVLVHDSPAVRANLERLRRIGCRIALDDFGTGWSSMSYVARFRPDRIKIDRAFVRDVDRSPQDAAIAFSILTLAASLGIAVTAEGIERPGQLEWLRARGCDEAQGFLLARPLPVAELETRVLNGAAADAPVPVDRLLRAL